MGPCTWFIWTLFGVVIAAGLVILWQAICISGLREKNEAQRQMIESPAPQPEKPSRVKVLFAYKGQWTNEIVYGNRFVFPGDGRLTITDQKDKVCATFGAGKWVSAVVTNEPAKPVEPPKEAT